MEHRKNIVFPREALKSIEPAHFSFSPDPVGGDPFAKLNIRRDVQLGSLENARTGNALGNGKAPGMAPGRPMESANGTQKSSNAPLAGFDALDAGYATNTQRSSPAKLAAISEKPTAVGLLEQQVPGGDGQYKRTPSPVQSQERQPSDGVREDAYREKSFGSNAASPIEET